MGMSLTGNHSLTGTSVTIGMVWTGTGGGTPTGAVYLAAAISGPGLSTTSAWKAAGSISSGNGSGSASVTISGLQPGGTYTYNVQGAVGGPGPAAYGSSAKSFTVPVDGGSGGGGGETETNTAPVPSIISPANGANLGTLDPDFTIGFYDADRSRPYPYNSGFWDAYQIEVEQPAGTPKWSPGWQSLPAGSTGNESQITVNYGGASLTAGVAARVRVRVRDSKPAFNDDAKTSGYTGWVTFTPQSIPGKPTVILPASPVNTLTPLIKGTYVAGASLGSEDSWQYEIWDGGTRIYASGWIASAIATGQTYGTANAGSTPASAPALQWGKLYTVKAKTKDSVGGESDWASGTMQLNRRPTTPTGLQPSGGAVTGDPSPTLTWVHNDPDGDAQSRARVDLYEVASGTRVAGYPKVVEGSAQSHVVDAVLSTSPPTTYAFRVQTEGADGTAGYSDYSDPAEFIVASAPPVEITSPLPDAILTAPSFTVIWNYEGDLGPQATWQVIVRNGLGEIVHDTGQTAGTDESYIVPSGVLRNLSPYTVTVYVTDTNARPAQSSQVPFSTAFTPPATITGLSAVVIGGTP